MLRELCVFVWVLQLMREAHFFEICCVACTEDWLRGPLSIIRFIFRKLITI